MKIAILSPEPLKLPTVYEDRGLEPLASRDVSSLLDTLRSNDVRLILVDLAVKDGPSVLPRIAQALTATDPKPFVALFGLTSGRLSSYNGDVPGVAYPEPATEEMLSQALEEALPYLRLMDQVGALRDEARRLGADLAESNRAVESREEKIARLEKRVFDFFTLSQVGKALASIQGLHELARVFLSMVKEIYDSRNCALLLYDEKRHAFVVETVLGLAPETVSQIVFSISEGLFWQLLNAGEPFPIIDSQGSYRFEQLIRRNQLNLLESELWVPLRVKNSLVGLLTIGKKPDGVPYNNEERSYIAQLANQATVALEAARLNIQKEITARELAKKAENLSILYSVSKAMNFFNDLKRVLNLILDKAVDAVGAQKASLMLLNEESAELVVNVVRGVPPDVEHRINSGEMECAKIKLGEGIAGKVASTRKYMLVDDVRQSGDFADTGRSFVDNILCVPLITSDECIGVINVTNKKNGEKFTQDDVEIMMTLAGQAAVTIYNAKLYYLAITDGLTQLHIHRYFQQRLKEEIARARRFRHPVSLVMLDIDHFKRFNDTYGHQQGDLVLITVARVIRTSIREVDIAARYGGEEFSVICPETNREEAAILAERLRQRVEETSVPSAAGPLSVTISLGVASFPTDGATQEQLIRIADTALYEAKENGRNRVVLAASQPPGPPPVATAKIEPPDLEGEPG
ncbi:MAG: sensor domain-containing diguanylate cyclase [Candidatus Riflebacteria bacterium]|nr:sensor domain-containing diguanylate cyclase [Candidatus Riflebacteria bacterium]